MVHPDDAILFSTKKKDASGREKTWRNPKCMWLREESHLERLWVARFQLEDPVGARLQTQ